MEKADEKIINDLSAETIQGIIKMLLDGATWLEIAVQYNVDSTQIGYLYKKLIL